MVKRNKIEIQINATDNASKVLRGVAGNMQSIGKAATTAIAVGAAVATAAVAGFAVHSLQAFSSFEKGMNEVFTLMPDINEDAMTRMTKDVKMFSSEMKILPDEVIPALYQAISAGVPKDNVFDFLTVAQKAAVAGVSDLTTAVDGISSAVNAFEAAGLDATTASDQMFTAIRLGKTDFDKLSAGMAGVNSIASAVGVSFGDIMAAQAAMTAQGKGNAEAFTQMRGLLVELADGGTEVGKIFSETAGVGFTEFIAQGNNMSDAMKVIEQASRDTGIPILEMFGNIRAGQGALALTGDQAGRFADAIAAMGDSAGATDAAFAKMDRGLSRTMDGIRANFRNVAISVGGFLEPLVLPALEDMSKLLTVINVILTDPSMAGGALETLPNHLRGIGRFLGNIVLGFTRFFELIESGTNPLTALMITFNEIAGISLAPLVIAIDNILKGIQAIVEPIAQWVNENVELESVLIAIGLVMASVILPALASMAIALGVPLAIFGLLVLAVQGLKTAWETDFLGIRTTVTNFWDNTLHPFLLDVQTWFEDDLPGIIANLPIAFDTAVTAAQRLVAIGFAVLIRAADTVHTSIDQVKTIIELLAANGLRLLNDAAIASTQIIESFTAIISDVINEVRLWIEKNAGLILGLTALFILVKDSAIAIKAWGVVVGLAKAALLLFNPLVAGLSAKFIAANASAISLKATMLAAAAPIVAVGLAIAGVILQLQQFQRETRAAATAAGNVAAAGIEAGRFTQQDVQGRLFAEMQRQLGDLGARLLFNPAAAQLGIATPQQLAAIEAGRAAHGGRFNAGDIIRTHGLGSGREIFIPSVNGEIQNQAQRTDDSGNQRPVQITIHVAGVPTQQQGQQVAFRLVDALRRNGVQVEDSQT